MDFLQTVLGWYFENNVIFIRGLFLTMKVGSAITERIFFFFVFERISLCFPGWNAVVQS